MADALAEIASQGAANVATLPRDHVATESVARDDVARDHVVPSRSGTTPEGFKIRQRVEKPHASIYAHPKVFKAIREIAAAEGRKAHDIYMDGLRLVLQQYGRDFDKLNRGE